MNPRAPVIAILMWSSFLRWPRKSLFHSLRRSGMFIGIATELNAIAPEERNVCHDKSKSNGTCSSSGAKISSYGVCLYKHLVPPGLTSCLKLLLSSRVHLPLVVKSLAHSLHQQRLVSRRSSATLVFAAASLADCWLEI